MLASPVLFATDHPRRRAAKIIEAKKMENNLVTSDRAGMVRGTVGSTRTTRRVASSPLIGCLWVVLGRYSDPSDATTARYCADA